MEDPMRRLALISCVLLVAACDSNKGKGGHYDGGLDAHVNGDGGGPIGCTDSGATCTVNTDCCNLSCVAGKCAAAAGCVSDNMACTAGGTACCSGTCGSGGTCTPLNTMCKTAGNGCAANADCCSQFCTGGVCSLHSSYCTQPGDVCYRDTDCCTALCTIPTGATAGTCSTVSSPASCSIDGILCNGCGACCSRLCAPYGLSGVNICQPAGGCHVYGDLCKTAADCCGGEPTSTGLPGAMLVPCTPIAGTGLGFCDHPSGGLGGGHACDPEGDVCHQVNNPTYVCGNSTSRNDCCACIAGKTCCVLDPFGIPRCNALGGDGGIGCVPPGGSCSFAGDCCGGVPCVPDSTGALHCLTPNDGGACVPQGGMCSATRDCCAGYPCVIPAGSLIGVCELITPSPGPDGGTPPPPGCALYGQACSATVPCCNNIPCAGGFCVNPPG
jgi:hypothetical protein